MLILHQEKLMKTKSKPSLVQWGCTAAAKAQRLEFLFVWSESN